MATRLLLNTLRPVSMHTRNLSITLAKKQMPGTEFSLQKLAGLNQEMSERANIDLARTLDFCAIKVPSDQSRSAKVTSESITKKYFPYEKFPVEEDLYQRGVKGIQATHSYTKDGNIQELLVEIRADGNTDYRIEWLKKTLKVNPHPLLYIELFRNLCMKISMEKDPVIKKKLSAQALAYNVVGLNLMAADCNCCGVSFQEPTRLPESVHDRVYGDKEAEKAFVELIKNEHTYLLKNIKSLPSPTWVNDQGNNKPLPPEKWEGQRRELLESIFVTKEGSDKS